jgi:hypothetical protein
MIKAIRVHAHNVRKGDYLVSQISIRKPQTAILFSSDATHVYINKLKFDPNELVRIERVYNGNEAEAD